MTDAATVLSVRDLHKSYGRGRRAFPALRGIDLEVGRGSVFGLLGPNGAGKTTLVKVLLGLVRGWTGEAQLLGRPVGVPLARRRVGYLPEAHRLPGYLTGRQVIDLFGMLCGKSRQELRARANSLLERVDMLRASERKVAQYSKGMQQRIGLVQALVHDPEVVFLDEPTDGVDPVGRRAIREIIAELKAKGVTVFINSHLLMEIEMMCDRVVIMHGGRILREGTIEDLTPRTGTVTIEVHDPPADLAGVLAGIGTELRVDGAVIELQLDDAGIDAAVDRLRARGVSIRGLRRRRLSLEEYFIELVGKDAPRPADGGGWSS